MRLKDLRTNACRIACEHQESRDVRIGQADCRLLLRPELQCTTAVETSWPLPMCMSTGNTSPKLGEVELGQKETHNESRNQTLLMFGAMKETLHCEQVMP